MTRPPRNWRGNARWRISASIWPDSRQRACQATRRIERDSGAICCRVFLSAVAIHEVVATHRRKFIALRTTNDRCSDVAITLCMARLRTGNSALFASL
jgi:hypothetical protein